MREDNIIHLRGLEFYAYHGVLPAENGLGQKFIVDIDMYPAIWPIDSDSIDRTINYAEVYAVIKDCMENKKYKLIETVAEAIADRVLKEFPCERVRVEVHKPNAPIPGIIRDVSVEIWRGGRK
ncbi:MAG: dihydroneopterin aldolase [Peptococcaceae bacterium]|jgi:dihydroneopterin aldolase|nr:dihydroneopterin aldolase [Peptococcaceae bacterium]